MRPAWVSIGGSSLLIGHFSIKVLPLWYHHSSTLGEVWDKTTNYFLPSLLQPLPHDWGGRAQGGGCIAFLLLRSCCYPGWISQPTLLTADRSLIARWFPEVVGKPLRTSLCAPWCIIPAPCLSPENSLWSGNSWHVIPPFPTAERVGMCRRHVPWAVGVRGLLPSASDLVASSTRFSK